MFRWLIGGTIALWTGAGLVVVPLHQLTYGWDRDATLMGVVYLWVFAGSIAFIMRREAGRRILRGASTAFALVAALLLVLTTVQDGGLGAPLAFVVGLTVSLLIWAGLTLPSVRSEMRLEK
jgi:hypothetical protein